MAVRPLHFIEQVGLRLGTTWFLALVYHVLEVHLLCRLLNLDATRTTDDQVIIAFPVALLSCFIDVSGWANVWRVGSDHTILINRVAISWVSGGAYFARSMITIDTYSVSNESALTTSRALYRSLRYDWYPLAVGMCVQVTLTAIISLTINWASGLIIIGVGYYHLVGLIIATSAINT